MSYVPPSVQPSGNTFSQFQAGGTTGQLERLINTNSLGSSNPTAAASISANGGGTVGGNLAPGSYYLTFTETNGFGETLASPESTQFVVSAQSSPTTAPQISVTGGGTTGGKLLAGNYYAKYTWVDSNNNGETTPSPESTLFTLAAGNIPQVTLGPLPAWSSGANVYLTAANGVSGSETLYATGVNTLVFTASTPRPVTSALAPISNTTSTSIPQVTFPAFQAGNIARNVYLTSAGGLSGTEQLYIRGILMSTSNLTAVAPGSNFAIAAPRTNTTAWSNRMYEMVRSVKDGRLDSVYRRLRQTIYDYNRGTPSGQADILSELAHAHAVFALLAQLCSEVGTLVEANPGHITAMATGIGTSAMKRHWP